MSPTNSLVPTSDPSARQRGRASGGSRFGSAFGALLATLLTASVTVAENLDLPRFPSVSPDGQEVVFSWRGDLWKVSAAGGRAVRLTSHPANELVSAWSPDGSQIAFESDRDGYRNIWIMDSDGRELRQLTSEDRPLALSAFGSDPDGRPAIYFFSALEGDLYRSPRPYRVGLEGGQPQRVHDAFGSFAVPDARGGRTLFERGGSSWMRRHYRGPDNRDIWLHDHADGSFRQLTWWDGNDGHARFVDDATLLFLSDRQLDTVNLYRMRIDGGEPTAERLTDFDGVDIVSFDVAADGSAVVVHVWDSLHRLDLRRPGGEPERIAITASEDRRDMEELRDVGRNVTEAAMSPDGKTIAVIAYGDVYVRAIEENAPTRAVTRTEARARDLAWSPDGLRLFFTIDEDGREAIRAATVRRTRTEVRTETAERLRSRDASDEPDAAADEVDADIEPPQPANDADDADGDANGHVDDVDDGASLDDEQENGKEKVDEGEDPALDPALDPARWTDAVAFSVVAVVDDPAGARSPSPSPDGRFLAYRRGLGDLVLLDLASDERRTLVEGWDAGIEWRWSADGLRIAFQQNDRNFTRDIFIVDVDGDAAPINVTRHPGNDSLPRFSADGKLLAFISGRVNRENDVWVVSLDPELDALTPLERDAHYRDAATAARRRKPLDPKKAGQRLADEPPVIEAHRAYRRLRRITRMSGGEWNLELTPGGDRFVFTASEGDGGLFSVKWDGSDQKRLTGRVDVQHLTLTGDRVVFVDGGRAGSVKVEGGDLKYHDIAARIRIDLQEQSTRKFRELARTLGDSFYHPTMKDHDWDALTERYLELASATRTPEEFNFVANRFLGEMNASHMGVNSPEPASPLRQAQGRLGTDHTPEEGGFRVHFVLPDSPAAMARPPVLAGDVIVGIGFDGFGPGETVESRLAGRIGEEVPVTLRRDLDGEPVELTTFVTPTSWNGMRLLRYESIQARARELVHEWSDGRLGYIHIAGMNQPSLDEFERDLFAAADGRDGLIIDVRNNGGGWTADRLLSSIMVQPHAYTVPRGMDPSITDGYPQDRLFIQRYALPINMLCNEKSFSNAEIVAHAFKTLGRGTLVGNQTYGGVISTGGFSLIDGTTVRLPFRGWYLPDGTDMENNGAVPDIAVAQTPEAEAADEDEQLRAAVDDLLNRL